MPSASDVYFIDTNIFVYAAADASIEITQLAGLQSGSQRVIRAMGAGTLRSVTSLTVLQEVLYLLTRWARQRQQAALYEAGRLIVRSALVLTDEVLAPTVLEFSRAVEAYAPDRDFNDLLIVETMRTHGITTIVSADRHMEALNVTRLDPREWCS
jgi:predicted nucleic acid-binding protein